MNAIQPSRPQLQTVKPRRVPQSRSSRRPYRFMALQTTAKLTVNVLLSAAAVSALVKLLPYYQSQQEKLQEIQTEVNMTQGRVASLRTEFSRYFDPQQAKSIMQDQSNRVDPGQRSVFLLNKAVAIEQPAASR